MNILGLVFPASFLQQSDHHQTSESNGSLFKCPAVNYITRTFKSRTKETQGVEFLENYAPNASVKKISNSSEEIPRCSSDMNISSDLTSTATSDEPTRRNSRRKKKKKRKLNKVTADNVDPETADFSLTCSSMQNSSFEEISCQTGMIRVDLNSAMAHKDNRVHCDSASSLSTLKSDRSKYLSKRDDVGSLSGMNKLNSANSLSQDSTFGQNKVAKFRNKKFTKKQDMSAENFSESASVKAVTGTECKHEYLQDRRCCTTGLSDKLPHHGGSDLTGSNLPPRHGDHISHGSCRNDSNRRNERSNMSQDKVIAQNNDRPSKRNGEATLTSSSKPCTQHATINSGLLTSGEVVRDGTNEDVQFSNQFPVVTDNPTVAPREDIKYDVYSKTSNGISQASCVSTHKQTGKESTHLVWQKTGKNVGDFQSSHKKRCNSKELCAHSCSSNTTSQRKQNNVRGDGPLEASQLSYVGREGLQRIDNLGISDHVGLGTNRQVLVESPEWVAHEKSHAGLCCGNMPQERLKDVLNKPFKQENLNSCKRGSWVNKTSLSNPWSKSDIVLTETLEDSRTRHLKKSNIAGQRSTNDTHKKSYLSGLYEFSYLPSLQPHSLENILVTGELPGEAHDHLGEKDSSSACFTKGLSYINGVRESARPRESLRKWIPVGKKYHSAVETNENIGPCTREARHEMDCVGVCAAGKTMQDSNGMEHLDLPRHGCMRLNNLGDSQNNHPASNCIQNNLPTYDSPVVTKQALNASYILQIAAESVQLTTNSTVPEFEIFLDSASPLIVSSYILQNCEDIIGCQPILNPFSIFHGHNVSLSDVWNWYERPGNYGLEVKAQGHQTRGKSGTDCVSCSAYFVPFLSAVQLFGQSDFTCISNSLADLHPDVREREKSDDRYFSSLNASPEFVADKSASDHTSAYHVWKLGSVTSHGSGCLNSTSAPPSSYSKLIFEYFEHEPPQQRKPLYSKVKDLVETGTSNPQVFGDPSKLEHMDLQDLHPASWYSVAWYPIYRIPEGSFRASFLTYHCLGHLVPRSLGSDSVKENAFSVVSPVVGMQSYNAQSEGWYDLKTLAESSWKDDMPPLVSSAVEERLRSLKDTAALFARGLVHKDQIDVPNRHPDYEFFLSRRQ